jgi:drug/metabolite transporter (DMT)-like permease
MYYSHLANVNVGIITTIWAVQPLIAGFLDFCIYGEKLYFHHLVGILMVIASALCISLAPKEDNQVPLEMAPGAEVVPKWVAVMFGFMTPCFFVSSGLFIKHLTKPSVGFDPITISFSTSSVVSLIIMILGASWFWQVVEKFQTDLFLLGLVGSIFDTIGKACIQKAYSRGPAGPVSAFVEMNNVLLVIIEALRMMRSPHPIEIVGFACGIGGGMTLCIPDQLKKIFCPCMTNK